jgi:hypothetical protein
MTITTIECPVCNNAVVIELSTISLHLREYTEGSRLIGYSHCEGSGRIVSRQEKEAPKTDQA